MKKLNKSEREKIKLNRIQKEILVGTLLGDGWLETATDGRTYRFGFKQKLGQQAYVNFVYEFFKNCCGSPPIVNKTDYQFKTLTLPCLRFYGQLFYGRAHKKKVPPQIHRWLTARALAHWYMDDGNKNRKGGYLFTNCFQKEDVQILCNALKHNFGLDYCWLRKRKSNNGKIEWFIYISAKSFKDFSTIIKPYVRPTMVYKLYNRNKHICPKGNGEVQRSLQVGRKSTVECKGTRGLDCKTNKSSRSESWP